MLGWTRRDLLAGSAALTTGLAAFPGPLLAQDQPKRGGTITVAIT